MLTWIWTTLTILSAVVNFFSTSGFSNFEIKVGSLLVLVVKGKILSSKLTVVPEVSFPKRLYLFFTLQCPPEIFNYYLLLNLCHSNNFFWASNLKVRQVILNITIDFYSVYPKPVTLSLFQKLSINCKRSTQHVHNKRIVPFLQPTQIPLPFRYRKAECGFPTHWPHNQRKKIYNKACSQSQNLVQHKATRQKKLHYKGNQTNLNLSVCSFLPPFWPRGLWMVPYTKSE